MLLLVFLVTIHVNPVVLRYRLQLLHSSFQLLQVFALLYFDFLALIDKVLELIDLVLQERETLRRVIDLRRVLLRHTARAHGYITGLANEAIHAFLAAHLLVMKLLEHFLVVLDLLLGLADVALEVEEELGGLDLVQPPLNPLMLFYQVLDRLVRVFDFPLPGTDLLGTRTVWVPVAPDTIGGFFLFEGLLVHLVDEEVHILTHLLKLVSQLLVLRLQVLLFLSVIS